MIGVALVSDEELRSHHCLEAVDGISGDLDTVAVEEWEAFVAYGLVHHSAYAINSL